MVLVAMDNWWEIVWVTVVTEFSDLSSPAQFTTVVLRLLVAAALGGVLGFERETRGKSAGMRTHMLVALGSALFVLVPQQAGASHTDITRVLQGLVAGVGFLGAGSIIKGSNDGDVKGLTTAASIWLTAAIGMSAGLGREASAVFSTLMAVIIMALLPSHACYARYGGSLNSESDENRPEHVS